MLLAAPFIPVLGNHEKNSVSYYNAFSHPAGAGQNDERWWTLQWGDVVVVGLDTSVNRADRIHEQQAYARAELAGPETWKFVIFHHPVYSSDAYHGSGYGYETDLPPDLRRVGRRHRVQRPRPQLRADRERRRRLPRARRRRRRAARSLLRRASTDPSSPSRTRTSTLACRRRPDELTVDIVSVAEAGETTFGPTSGELLDSFTLHAPAAPAAVRL